VEVLLLSEKGVERRRPDELSGLGADDGVLWVDVPSWDDEAATVLGARGHVHYIELDQFEGPHWLITVHGPVNPAVPGDVALEETGRSPVAWRPAACARPRPPTCRSRWSRR
jgi:hypothetical protein